VNSSSVSRIAATLAVIALSSSSGFGQFLEIEPNQPCAAAQDSVEISWYLPLEITGEISRDDPATPALDGDVDFFYVEPPPNVLLRASIPESESTWWPNFDPLIGLFDEDCNYISDSVWTTGGDDVPHLDFLSPTRGGLTIGVSAGNDAGLWGHHYQAGLYNLRLAELPEPATLIRGRVTDAATGHPLGPAWFLPELYSSQGPLWVWVSLYRCEDGGCEETANVPALQRMRANPLDGTFSFVIVDGASGTLSPASYLLKVDAYDYASTTVGPFEAHIGHTSDVGDIELTPPPLVFSNLVSCDGPLTSRSRCQYSVEVTNTTASDVRIRVWSLVEGRVKPAYEFTRFPAMPSFRVAELAPYSTETLRFAFYAPSYVPAQFKSLCADVQATDETSGFFKLLRHSYLFCMVERNAAFQIAPIEASYVGASGGVK